VPTPNFLVKKEVEGDYQVAAPAESRTPNNYDRPVRQRSLYKG
jgi:hypothetical protein